MREGTAGVADVEPLPEHVCWELLRTAPVGRLAFVGVDGGPDVRPLNFVVDHGEVVVRTHPGGALWPWTTRGAAPDGVDVAFEVDGVWGAGGGGTPTVVWSVVLRGRAVPVSGTSGALEVDDLPLRPYWSGAGDLFLRVRGVPSGRRVRVVGPERWGSASGARPHTGGPE